jgi:hypothetical protein
MSTSLTGSAVMIAVLPAGALVDTEALPVGVRLELLLFQRVEVDSYGYSEAAGKGS